MISAPQTMQHGKVGRWTRNNVVMALITLAWAVRKTMKTLLWQCPGKVSNQGLHLYT